MSRHTARVIVFVAAALLLAGTATATERYNGATSDYCVNCHPSFQGRSDLHDLHQGNGAFTNTCRLCHVSTGDNPLIMYSLDDGSGAPGCMGCHGHDYGETFEADYGNNLAGLPKNSGYGLRLQHFNKGVTGCSFCHGDAFAVTPKPENENPAYYGRADVSITDACNADGSEDGTPEPNGEDMVGLDNDGDLLIDGADPDCSSGGTPGESGSVVLAPLLVTGNDPVLGTLDLSIGVACGATDQTLVWGPLSAVGSYGYGGQDCSIDDSGTHNWNYGTMTESKFFLVVANDGAVEGSYGEDGAAGERPEDTVSTACSIPQDLLARCD